MIVLFIFFFPLPFHPPGDTRIILDHTLRVYVAPPCFNDAALTNYLTETTWSKAREKGYEPESACTAERMKPTESTIWNKLREMAGLIPSSWRW